MKTGDKVVLTEDFGGYKAGYITYVRWLCFTREDWCMCMNDMFPIHVLKVIPDE